jgi:hypothetical protein
MREQVLQESVRHHMRMRTYSSSPEFQKSFYWISVGHRVSGGLMGCQEQTF